MRIAKAKARAHHGAGYPIAQEMGYQRILVARVTGVHGAVRRILSGRLDAAQPAGAMDLLGPLWRLRASLEEPNVKTLHGVAEALDAFVATEAKRQVAAGISDPKLRGAISGINLYARDDVRGQILGWVRNNVELIKTIDARYFNEIESLILDGHRTGLNTRALASQIEDRFGVSKSRAKLIARDQIGKLNGQLSEERQRQVGVAKYQWSTSGDERVREEHADLDGEIRRWDDPHPTEGHPGSAINCRCTALAVFDEADEDRLVAIAAEQQAHERSIGRVGAAG